VKVVNCISGQIAGLQIILIFPLLMNRLEEGALGDPVLAGNLGSNPDGRRGYSWPSSGQLSAE
jgi:hypothetical protein